MRLFFMYGAPASGKLTIAEKLSAATGIPLFHNHLSRDLVENIYPDSLKQNYALVDQIRRDVLVYCAAHQTDIIFTYVYEGAEDDADVHEYVTAIEQNAGQVQFIEVTARREDLLLRAGNDSRKVYKKLTDPIKLAQLTEDMTKYTIPYVDSLIVDTSQLSADAAVSLIINQLLLSTVQPAA